MMIKTLRAIVNFSKFGVNIHSASTNFYSGLKITSIKNYSSVVPVFSKRFYCSTSGDDKRLEQQKNVETLIISGSVKDSGKYEIFKDENAPLVLDVIEERQRMQDLEDEEVNDEFAGLNLERGVTGVFDIEDLVEVLQRENAVDIFVAKLPSYIQYVDYIVVVSGRSLKHMLGLAEFIRRLYKIKRHKKDLIPRLEGETSKDWLALDLGNIALHILSKSARPIYDIESLWAVGKEFDEKSMLPQDPLAEFLKKHSINLDDFQPADDSLR